MSHKSLMIAAGVVLAAGGLVAARHDASNEGVRPLAVREIVEKLDTLLESSAAAPKKPAARKSRK